MKTNLIYPLLIVIASSSYGILSTIVKVAMQHGFTSSEAVSSQYIIGFMLVATIFIITQRQLPKLSKNGLLILVSAGIFTGITGIVYGESLKYLPASLAVVMLFQFTWIGLLLDCVFHKRLPSRPEVISIIVLFAGTILAAGVLNVDLSGIAIQGWLFGLAAAFTFACFIQFNSRPVEGITTTSRVLIVSFVALIMISIFLNPEIAWNGKLFTEGLWKFGLALGLFGIILPIYLFSIAVPKVGGALASILSAIELPVAVTVSVIVLHESLTLLQIVGIILVILGMLLPTMLANRKITAP
ncbi:MULTISPECIES: EamA family transporter [unclassified Lysinibacillus]|uniref:EamA family transporter n=1 Tax=unclassified Lysinibacillus TaxID=2636778 RepID=UPI0011229049|nr:DMT family transporter [Lysinibacillus sp. CD3-6]QPQ33588.1 DMT family transporter [Lysinibacillus sp. JNUCC-52]UED80474.1 DMT family transporter [Lysinibacillus sp. CD3-6]